ncbi:hypothetical protein GALL_509330 [mine drainage metagenome]|uniref:Uncharacterized protein n=1 Tax=mine drainage metagenome TaxID=410659 RepID=A0A1J5P7C4_9ZZZZ
MQTHQSMGVVNQGFPPADDGASTDTQLFMQFALQRLLHRFTGFELSTGKLPVAGIDLARGT